MIVFLRNPNGPTYADLTRFQLAFPAYRNSECFRRVGSNTTVISYFVLPFFYKEERIWIFRTHMYVTTRENFNLFLFPLNTTTTTKILLTEYSLNQYREFHIDKMIIDTLAALRNKTFPWKLHAMLELADREGFSEVVSWLPDGKSFKVYNPRTFVKDIMPNFFQQSKYKSFQRQCKYNIVNNMEANAPTSL